MLVLSVAIGLLAAAVVVAVVVRRRRAARGHGLSLAAPHGSAGVSHLATRVSELSDLGLHLHPGAVQRRRIGSLLGSSSAASR